MAKLYPDISHHHPVTDWVKVKENCVFLISKATEGRTYVDPTLDSFINNCEKLNIPYWLYTYLRRGNEKEQAEFMVQTCKGKVGKNFVGYVLDIEEENDCVNVINALEWLEKQETKVMIYFMYSQYNEYEDLVCGMGENTVFWEARYGKNDGTYNPSFPCHSKASLHQYTSAGKVDGITGNIDLNRITGYTSEKWFLTPLTVKTDSIKNVSAAGLPDLSGYVGTSIVDALNGLGYKSSFADRKKYWKMANQKETYIGTATQNIKLITLLGGKVKEKYYLPSLKGYKGFSIVDGLKKFGYDPSFAHRKIYYARAGFKDEYKGTMTQNIKLLQRLKEV